MDPDLSTLEPSDITFIEHLSSSDYAAHLLHKGQGPKPPYSNPNRETNTHKCEVSAYKRLSSSGLCDKGRIPEYYGSMQNINTDDYTPHLDAFRREHEDGNVQVPYDDDEYADDSRAQTLNKYPEKWWVEFENRLLVDSMANTWLVDIGFMQKAHSENGEIERT
ncbi:hypothetical protein BDV06DRAFT_225431 [Aspergillus oleicola]